MAKKTKQACADRTGARTKEGCQHGAYHGSYLCTYLLLPDTQTPSTRLSSQFRTGGAVRRSYIYVFVSEYSFNTRVGKPGGRENRLVGASGRSVRKVLINFALILSSQSLHSQSCSSQSTYTSLRPSVSSTLGLIPSYTTVRTLAKCRHSLQANDTSREHSP